MEALKQISVQAHHGMRRQPLPQRGVFLLARLVKSMSGIIQRRETAQQLDRLNDHQLRDIGLSRQDLEQFSPPGTSRREPNRMEMLLLLHRG